MHIHGACHCGSIRFEAEADPARTMVCHCTDCQILSGAPYRASVAVEEEALRWLAGTPTVYLKTTAASGRVREQGFCGTCGTPLYSVPAAGQGVARVYMMRAGCIGERAALVPTRQIWCEARLDWIDGLDAVPASPRG